MEELHFLRPYWLLTIIVFIALWFFARQKSQQGAWNQLLAPQFAALLVKGPQSSNKGRGSWLFLLFWLICAIALSGPSWQKQPMPLYQVENGRVLILDMSQSMLANDLSPNRLSIVRYKAQDLLLDWQEGQSALVAYADDAFVISPLSSDSQTIISQLPALHPDIMPKQGSNVLPAIEQGIQLLKGAGLAQGQLVLFTDGIDTESLDEINSLLKNSPWQLTIVGFGSEQGAPIKQSNGQYLKHEGEIIVASLNSQQLKQHCLSNNCHYLVATADNSDIIQLRSLLKTENKKTQHQQQEQATTELWFDGGIYFVYLLIPLFLVLFYRQTLLICLCLLLPLSYQPKLLADELNEDNSTKASIGSSLWHNQATRAQQAFDNKDFEQAAKLYKTKEWQGTAQYKAGNFEQAAQLFSQLNTATGYYNQGNALAKLGDYDKAIAAYDKALNLDPQHSDAKSNKDLLEQLKQQQEQQQQDQQDQNEPEQDKQQNPENQSENEQKKQDNKQNQSEQNQDNQDSQKTEEGQQGSEQQEQQNKSADEQSQQEQKQELTEQQKQALKEQREKENQAAKQQTQQQELSAEQQQEMMQQIQGKQEKPIDPELKQLFRQLPDDPALLLRNRMLLEQEKRKTSQLESNQQW